MPKSKDGMPKDLKAKCNAIIYAATSIAVSAAAPIPIDILFLSLKHK